MTEGVAALEHATQLANQMSLFSDNEDLEEVATSSMKWVLVWVRVYSPLLTNSPFLGTSCYLQCWVSCHYRLLEIGWT